MGHRHDPRKELPKPSPLAARRIVYQVGDEVVFMQEPYTLLMVLDISKPPHPGWPVGTYVALWKPSYPKCQMVFVPLKDIEQPVEFAA